MWELWPAHPVLTLLVIVGTAHHYWLDAIVAATLLGLALAVIVPRTSSAGTPVPPRRTAAPAGRSRGGPAPARAEERTLVGAGR
ncbi:hypothetical protein ACWD0Z_08685 [Streptomyces sp. NPDC003007]